MKQRQKVTHLWPLLLPFLLLWTVWAGYLGVTALTPAEWSDPTIAWAEEWADPRHFSLDDTGTRLVALLPYEGESDTSRPIAVSEKIGGLWQEPIILANNAFYSQDTWQWFPHTAYPVISGDGQTIAYAGYTGSTYAPYVAYRQNDGTWSQPISVTTGLDDVHYWLTLSGDGQTLAFSDYPFATTQHIYVVTRTVNSPSWSMPVRVTPLEGDFAGGWMPALGTDGQQLVYLRQGRVMWTTLLDGVWQPPQPLTNNEAETYEAEYPQISRDGRSVYYWLVKLVPIDTGYMRTEQDLYVLRRQGTIWGESEKVTAVPLVPSGILDGPAAANETATRFVYSRPITESDPLDGTMIINMADLELAEWGDDGWQGTRLLAANGFGNMNHWPRLTPDGLSLLFAGGTRYVGGSTQVNNALWEMSTAVSPPPRPLPSRTTAVVPPSGGSLFSEIDQTMYDFGENAFTQTVTVTHQYEPVLSSVPAGLASLNGFRVTAVDTLGEFVQPNRPVSITVSYGELPPGPTIPGTHRLYGFNNAEHSWYPIPTVEGGDDAETRTMSGQLAYFSRFAILGETNQQFLPFISRP